MYAIVDIETTGGSPKTEKITEIAIYLHDGEKITGEFTTLINQMEDLPENYNITVTASDGWTTEFTMDQVYGEIDLYNETGDIIEEGIVTMILAYKEDGEYINDLEVGPLRIAFIGEDVITSSSLWSKMVESIEIIEV